MKSKKMQPWAGRIIALVVIIVVAVVMALVSRDIPAPEGTLDKPLPADKFLGTAKPAP